MEKLTAAQISALYEIIRTGTYKERQAAHKKLLENRLGTDKTKNICQKK